MTMQPDAAVWVVKIGGALCDSEAGRERFARACAATPHPLVVVHGGGTRVTGMQEKLGTKSRFVEGRRVTTAEDLEIVEMVLSGSLNKSLVRALAGAGLRAAGIAGCDAGLVRCERVAALGHVGRPVHVDVALLRALLAAGFVPVVSPVSLDENGQAVNVNADEVASALAVGLGAERLLLLSDVAGVRIDASWQIELAADEVEALVARGEVRDGMTPKLRAAAAAVGCGVRAVHIAGFDGEPLADVRGTRVHARSAAWSGGDVALADGTRVHAPPLPRPAELSPGAPPKRDAHV